MLEIEVAGHLAVIADGISRHPRRQPLQQRRFAGAVIAGKKGDWRLEFEAFQMAQRRNRERVIIPPARAFLHGYAVEKQHVAVLANIHPVRRW
ncbi:hypothetical protein D3C86_1810430 [compost metagenome]